MRRRWRLLLDPPASGPWNMGVDEALLASAQRGGTPTLRLYTWEGPWLSLGYGQRCSPARRSACQRAGVGVVRRTSGGRAVLHGRDLTYALAAPEELLPAGLRASYGLVAGALRAALQSLGVAAERGPVARPGAAPEAFDCFAAPATDELCVGGRKLVGSAQRRSRGGVLQHGSIRLAPDAEAARVAAGLDGPGATSLLELGCTASGQRLRERCALAFAEALGARLEIGRLDPAEAAFAADRGPFGPLSEGAPRPSGFSRVPPCDR